MRTGACFVTFKEHTAPVSAVAFLPSGHAVLSASLDGTVRAFDLVRYRNFRTFTAPEPCQARLLLFRPHAWPLTIPRPTQCSRFFCTPAVTGAHRFSAKGENQFECARVARPPQLPMGGPGGLTQRAESKLRQPEECRPPHPMAVPGSYGCRISPPPLVSSQPRERGYKTPLSKPPAHHAAQRARRRTAHQRLAAKLPPRCHATRPPYCPTPYCPTAIPAAVAVQQQLGCAPRKLTRPFPRAVRLLGAVCVAGGGSVGRVGVRGLPGHVPDPCLVHQDRPAAGRSAGARTSLSG